MMSRGSQLSSEQNTPQSRWTVTIAVLSTSALHYAMPNDMSMAPSWSQFLFAFPLLAVAGVTYYLGQHKLNKLFGFVLLAVLTLFMVLALTSLVEKLILPGDHPLKAPEILRGAACLWASNVLIFALWYWKLDAGGPHLRDAQPGHAEGAFLFPQMTLSPEFLEKNNMENWSPGFVDYLFVAFNTSTALSPADTSALSRWAKVMMMLQALISLSILVLLAARAVNILT